jgi:hypothetical protein
VTSKPEVIAATGVETALFQNPSRNGTRKRLIVQPPSRAIFAFQKRLILESEWRWIGGEQEYNAQSYLGATLATVPRTSNCVLTFHSAPLRLRCAKRPDLMKELRSYKQAFEPEKVSSISRLIDELDHLSDFRT